MSESIADRFIRTMALINQIEYRNDDPMRFAAYKLRDMAQGILSDAISKADDAAYTALQMQKDFAEAIANAEQKGGA